MFTEIEKYDVSSANKRENLKPGVYIETQLCFINEGEKSCLIIRQFMRDGDESCSVIDMVHIDNEKSNVIFQDFVLTDTGEWLSGNGKKSFNLADFLPDSFVDYVYTGSMIGDVIEVTS